MTMTDGGQHRLLRQQTVLAKFGELTLRSNNLDQILTEACSLVGEALGTDLAKVMALQNDGTTLLVRAGVGWKPGVVGEATIKATDNTSEGIVLRTGEPMISPDVSKEVRFDYPHFLIDNGVRALANVLIIGGTDRPPFGVLQVDSREPRSFNDDDTDFLRTYANLLAAAVERLRAMGEVHDTAERLRFALQVGRLGIWELELSSSELTTSPTCKENFGRHLDEPFSLQALQDALYPEDRERMATALNRAVFGTAAFSIECRLKRVSGVDGWVQLQAQVVRGLDGSATRVSGISLDITDRVLIEERLRQSQRVEAVGRLTAGVAHDFNNVLQVLLSGIELAMDGLDFHDSMREDLDLALRAGQRGALLTSHLLSFSRQQVLRPRALNLTSLVEGLAYTLARTLGRHVAVRFQLEDSLPPIFIDAVHLDSAILNLALNARDAMAQGGELTIEAYLARGQVVIAVVDTGQGMTPEVLSHACEPFFSTKGLDGSGMGLPMVQGFARQSGGELRIFSTVGKGTRAELCLPTAQSPPQKILEVVPQEVRGTGHILVVDDDTDVGRISAAFLTRVGFNVVTVISGDQALAALSIRRFDVLMTDYSMTGMNGVDLVLHAREMHSGIPVIIITGYPGAIGLSEVPPDVMILHKPFQRTDLIKRIKLLVEGSRSSGQPDMGSTIFN